jgi:protein-S-isoprenylcysteine O-methyltransferase Ste14
MVVLIRAAVYATLFVALVLVFLPGRVLEWSGVSRPTHWGTAQVVGLVVVLLGAGLAAWCILTFAFVGWGTPAPFDPPRRLVVRGPYRFVRNPMYLGAAVALAGAALFYGSVPLLGYVGLFLIVVHGFVVAYEEPTLRRLFGSEYEDYCRRVSRWRPTW